VVGVALLLATTHPTLLRYLYYTLHFTFLQVEQYIIFKLKEK